MSLLTTLKKLDRGKVIMEAEEAMAEILAGVLNTGGKGKLEIVLNVEIRDGECGAVAVEGNVKYKAPKPAHPAQTHYVSGRESGRLSLTRRDPSQPPLAGTSAEEDEDEAPRRRTVEVIDGQSKSSGEREAGSA